MSNNGCDFLSKLVLFVKQACFFLGGNIPITIPIFGIPYVYFVIHMRSKGKEDVQIIFMLLLMLCSSISRNIMAISTRVVLEIYGKISRTGSIINI